MVKKAKLKPKVTLAKSAKPKQEDVVYDDTDDEEDEKEWVEEKEPEPKPAPAPPPTADVSEQAFQPAPPPDQQPKLFPEPEKEK